MTPVRFNERMSGWIAFDERSYNQAMVKGRELGTTCSQRLTIEIDDLGEFLEDRRHGARASGVVHCDELGGRLEVEQGSFNLFVAHGGSPQHRRMLYRLLLRDRDGRPLTLSGFKDIQHGHNRDGWGDFSRLLIRILAGHQTEDPVGEESTIATGILHISGIGFARMLGSMVREGGPRGVGSVARFNRYFVGQLAKLYLHRSKVVNDADWPSPTDLDPCFLGFPEGEWHQLSRPGGLKRRIIRFHAGDGRQGTLHNIRGPSRPTRGPVLLAHGCSVRASMFYEAPVQQTMAEALIEDGYDVWAENWRGSIDLPASMWTLDDVAVYDHPAAVKTILKETGHETMKAVVHCQGSTSFMMSVLAGLVPEVTDVVSNAVSLHVNLTPRSKRKMRLMTPGAAVFMRGADPQWTARAPAAINHMLGTWSAFRGGHCDNKVCRSANYFYGVGGDVLWHHDNLNQATHEWGSREWGFCPMSFFKQMGRCAVKGHLVPTGKLPQLPQKLVDQRPEKLPRFTFIAGRDNICFLPAGQERTFAHFDRIEPGRHSLHVLPGYTHLDVFIGREAHRNVFPLIVGELDR